MNNPLGSSGPYEMPLTKQRCQLEIIVISPVHVQFSGPFDGKALTRGDIVLHKQLSFREISVIRETEKPINKAKQDMTFSF